MELKNPMHNSVGSDTIAKKKAETHLRSCQTFTIVIFLKIFNSYVPLTIFSKKARATDFSQGPKFSSEKLIIEQTVLFLF